MFSEICCGQSVTLTLLEGQLNFVTPLSCVQIVSQIVKMVLKWLVTLKVKGILCISYIMVHEFICVLGLRINISIRFNESWCNVKSQFKVQHLVTKIEFEIKKSQFSVKPRFKVQKCADRGYSLNRH